MRPAATPRPRLSSSLERNNTYFREERDKLEKWADDALAGAERALSDTKEQIKALTRQARTAPNTEAQHEIQQRIVDLEKKKAPTTAANLRCRGRNTPVGVIH